LNQQPRDWLQIIGHAGVIASLLFVGYQLKQDREIAVAATYQERTSSTTEVLTAIAANSAALSGLIKVTTPFDPESPSQYLMSNLGVDTELDVTPIEIYANVFTTLSVWQLYDNSHYQYSRGFLPEDHWLKIRDDIKRQMMGNPFFRVTYENQMAATQRSGFRAVIDGIVEEIEAEAAPD
jgi:hypothetical protein